MVRVSIPWQELWQRYTASLASDRPWLLCALAFLVVLGVPLVLGWPKRLPRWLAPLFSLPLAAFAVFRATREAWVADDAFISFRYAYNLAHGNGLVFNVGERVEGYTNFLWTLLATIPLVFRRSPVDLVLGTSLLSYAGVVFMTSRLVSLEAPKGRPVLFSFAALAIAGNFVMGSFATSGLETMTAALCVLIGVERATVGRPASAGAALAAATLLHPDHLVFGAALGATYLLDRDRKTALVRYLAPFVLTVVPHFIWRTWYYGDPLPNTYYAKAADMPYYSQGETFLAVNWFATGLLLALPLSVLGLLGHLGTRIGRFAWLGVPVYVLWVAKIGGDFMLGRLFVPVLPIILVLAELFVRKLAVRGKIAGTVAVLASSGVLLAGIPATVIKHRETAWHIANEADWYRLESLYPLKIDSGYFQSAQLLYRAFTVHHSMPRYASGCVGMVGYFTHLPILDTLGLNDHTIARKPIGVRGRPGHEKGPGPGDVIPRAPDFSDKQQWPGPYDRMTELKIERTVFYLMAYRGEIMLDLAAKPFAQFQDVRRVIDAYDPLQPNAGPDRRACDAWFYGTYYFAHNADPKRREEFLSKLGRADAVVRGVEPLLLAEPTADDPTWREVWREGFDDPKRWRPSGDAFRGFPTRQAIPLQSTVAPVRGSYADSFDPVLADDATGRLVSDPFTIVGDALTLHVGGGFDRGNLSVTLVIDGKPFAGATGCNSDVMGLRAWNVASFRGRSATLQIQDSKRGGWGHIVVDDVAQWERR